MELSEPAVTAIAALLSVSPIMEPYRVRGAAVTIILWPSLARVDVRVGDSAIAFKGVDEVLLYPGVEVMFRRAEPAVSLFISVSGRSGMTT